MACVLGLVLAEGDTPSAPVCAKPLETLADKSGFARLMSFCPKILRSGRFQFYEISDYTVENCNASKNGRKIRFPTAAEYSEARCLTSDTVRRRTLEDTSG
jgi:hypothetical protein